MTCDLFYYTSLYACYLKFSHGRIFSILITRRTPPSSKTRSGRRVIKFNESEHRIIYEIQYFQICNLISSIIIKLKVSTLKKQRKLTRWKRNLHQLTNQRCSISNRRNMLEPWTSHSFQRRSTVRGEKRPQRSEMLESGVSGRENARLRNAPGPDVHVRYGEMFQFDRPYVFLVITDRIPRLITRIKQRSMNILRTDSTRRYTHRFPGWAF